MNIYKKIVKPIADIFSALLLLVLLSPMIFCTIILLAFSNKCSVFFFQQRPGLNALPFTIIKFKTMKDAFDVNGNPLPDQERLTKVGNFIRSISLDEVLQLINVIKGDMSLVGPRPLLMKYLARYNEEQGKRHLVKPGITGLAQINGRNAITWEEKFKFDLEYVKNQSFSLDLRIIFQTIVNVIRRKGISHEGKATMDEFIGNM